LSVVGPHLAVFAYLAVAFLGGALLAPWAWWAVHGEAAWLPFLQIHTDFWRYVHRCVVGLLLLGLLPLARATGVNSWSAMGMTGRPGRGRRLAVGLAVGLGSFALLGVLATALLPVQWVDPATVDWPRHLAEAAVAMVLVSLIEELLHRGVLFNSLRASLDWRLAALGSSALFSLSHFLDARPDSPEPVTLTSGLTTLSAMAAPVLGDAAGTIRFITLFSAGMLLCGLVRRTGDLWGSMGVHAGWIFGGKLLTVLIVSGGAPTLWWNARNFLESGAVAAMITVMAVGVLVGASPRADG
jgi:membrane protease YdiL (CAAX protease family)